MKKSARQPLEKCPIVGKMIIKHTKTLLKKSKLLRSKEVFFGVSFKELLTFMLLFVVLVIISNISGIQFSKTEICHRTSEQKNYNAPLCFILLLNLLLSWSLNQMRDVALKCLQRKKGN